MMIAGPSMPDSGRMTCLGTGLQIVDETHEGRTAVEMTVASRPRLVVIDMAREDVDWVWAVKYITQRLPETKVALLGSALDGETLRAGARAGASCFIVATRDGRELIQAIASAEDGAPVPPLLNIRIDEQAGPPAESVSGVVRQPASDGTILTAREVEVLRHMALGKRNAEIAEELCISHRTVESHRRAILQKLGAQDRAQAILVAVRAGLLQV